jgi:hypothetical protein
MSASNWASWADPPPRKTVVCGASFVVQSSEVCFVYLVLRPGHVHDPVLFANVVTSELERTASYGRVSGRVFQGFSPKEDQQKCVSNMLSSV